MEETDFFLCTLLLHFTSFEHDFKWHFALQMCAHQRTKSCVESTFDQTSENVSRLKCTTYALQYI